MRTKILKDGFIWLEMGRDEAESLFRLDVEIYKLYDDGSESLVETMMDIIKHDGAFGIEVGYIQELEAQWKNL